MKLDRAVLYVYHDGLMNYQRFEFTNDAEQVMDMLSEGAILNLSGWFIRILHVTALPKSNVLLLEGTELLPWEEI